MCGLVVFRVCYKTWQMISAASQYEIWILVSSTRGDQSDNQDFLCNDVMTVSMVTLCMKAPHRDAHTDTQAVVPLLSSFSPYLLGELCPFSSVAMATGLFD